eukprot:403372494
MLDYQVELNNQKYHTKPEGETYWSQSGKISDTKSIKYKQRQKSLLTFYQMRTQNSRNHKILLQDEQLSNNLLIQGKDLSLSTPVKKMLHRTSRMNRVALENKSKLSKFELVKQELKQNKIQQNVKHDPHKFENTYRLLFQFNKNQKDQENELTARSVVLSKFQNSNDRKIVQQGNDDQIEIVPQKLNPIIMKPGFKNIEKSQDHLSGQINFEDYNRNIQNQNPLQIYESQSQLFYPEIRVDFQAAQNDNSRDINKSLLNSQMDSQYINQTFHTKNYSTRLRESTMKFPNLRNFLEKLDINNTSDLIIKNELGTTRTNDPKHYHSSSMQSPEKITENTTNKFQFHDTSDFSRAKLQKFFAEQRQKKQQQIKELLMARRLHQRQFSYENPENSNAQQAKRSHRLSFIMTKTQRECTRKSSQFQNNSSQLSINGDYPNQSPDISLRKFYSKKFSPNKMKELNYKQGSDQTQFKEQISPRKSEEFQDLDLDRSITLGDIQNNLAKLKSELKSIKYPHQIIDEDVQIGLPTVYLPIMHYALLVYSPVVGQFITEKGFELFAKNDFRFMESVYKLLLNQFNYKPSIQINQFFQNGFAERKIIFACEVIEIMKSKHQVLSKVQSIQQQKTQVKSNGNLNSQKSENLNKSNSRQQLTTDGSVKIIKHDPLQEINHNGFQNQPLGNHGQNQNLSQYSQSPTTSQHSSQNAKSPKISNQKSKSKIRKPDGYISNYETSKSANLNSQKHLQQPAFTNLRQQELTEEDDDEFFNSNTDQQNVQQPMNLINKQNPYQYYDSQNTDNSFNNGPFGHKNTTQSQQVQKQQDKQSEMNKDLMNLIVNLNESIKTLGQRFESFQINIEEKVNKISAEQMLMKNRVQILEKNCMGHVPSMDTQAYDFMNPKTSQKKNLQTTQSITQCKSRT